MDNSVQLKYYLLILILIRRERCLIDAISPSSFQENNCISCQFEELVEC